MNRGWTKHPSFLAIGYTASSKQPLTLTFTAYLVHTLITTVSTRGSTGKVNLFFSLVTTQIPKKLKNFKQNAMICKSLSKLYILEYSKKTKKIFNVQTAKLLIVFVNIH